MEVEKQREPLSFQESHTNNARQYLFMPEPQPPSSGDDDTSHSDRPSMGGIIESSLSNEPKSKKRRKQSNPVKYQSSPQLSANAISDSQSPSFSEKASNFECGDDPSQGAVFESTESTYACPHCSAAFQNDTQLTMHIEEEHVQKIVAKQIQQRNVSINAKIETETSAMSPTQSKPNKWPPPPPPPRNTTPGLETPSSLPLPHVPPLVSLSQTLTSSSKSLSLPLPPLFPGSLPPFLYSHLMSQRQTPPINGNSTTNASGIRIFNPEAFCELCSKEFCNKYFLKTHKANMHGVYSNDTPTSASFPGSYPSHPSGVQPFLPTSDPSLIENASPVPSGLPQHPSLIINKEAYCEICQKEFCNKYFLRKHRQKIHGIIDPNLSANNSLSLPNDLKTSMHLTSSMNISFSNSLPIFSIASEKNETNSSNGYKSDNSSILNFHSPKQISAYPSNIPTSSISPTYTSNEFQTSQSNEYLQPNGNSPQYKTSSSDAYCEICRKVFNNKYFLRTHLANVHGIHVSDISAKESPLNFSQMQPLQLTTSKTSESKSDLKLDEESKANREQIPKNKTSTDVNCDICTRPFASNYLLKMHKFYSHNVPYHHEEDLYKASEENNYYNNSNEVSEKTDNAIAAEDAASPDLQKLQTMIKELNAATNSVENLTNTTVCRLCHQECENKYFLRAHMMNEHGMLPNEDGSPLISAGSSFIPNSSSNSLSALEEAEFRQKLKLSHKFFSALNNNCIKGEEAFQHKNQDSPLALVSSSCSTSLPSPSIASSLSLIPHVSNSSVPLSLVPMNNSSITTSSFDPKSRPITGRNYCYICNKELCNKYFMKTHMLKMHGINLENQAQEASQISTIGGVTCDICQKELCSKYFLKVHKQNTHGIYDEPLPPKDNTFTNSTNNQALSNPTADKEHVLLAGEVPESNNRYFTHYTEVCPLCERRFKSIKWLKTHMVNDHNELIKESLSGPLNDSPPPPLSLPNPLPPPPPQLENNALICVLCGQGFAEKVTLQIHLIKDHRTPSEEMESNSGIKNLSTSSGLVLNDPMPLNGEVEEDLKIASSSSPPLSKQQPLNGGSSRIYQCSYCIYSTRWLSNLYAHEKRHTGLVLEGDKKFACRVCHRSYRYNHSLQRHMLSHRIAGLTLRETTLSSIILPQNLHMKNHDPLKKPTKMKRFRCSKCNKKFRTREMCMAHIHAYHRGRKSIFISQHKIFRCHICEFSTKNMSVLKLHIKKIHQAEGGPTNGCAAKSEFPQMELGFPGGEGLSPSLPTAYATPRSPPSGARSFIMQPFLIAQQPEQSDTFVPSLVYLPVSQKVSQPVTVAFTLTPA